MTQRRDFLRQASVLAAGSLAATPIGAVALDGEGAPPAWQGNWDMSWTERVTGKHRMCFDAHEVSDGVCLHQARSFIQGYKDVYGLSDEAVSAVLVIRHSAIAMVLGNPLWDDGFLGEMHELKDPETGEEPTKRNPFINVPTGARYGLTWPDGGLDTLMSRGVIVLCCDLALRNVTGRIARHRSLPRSDAAALVDANLLPGVYRMPTGIFATSHAQALGCGVLNAV